MCLKQNKRYLVKDKWDVLVNDILETRGTSGPEIAYLFKADHDMLHRAMVAILAIRSDCL